MPQVAVVEGWYGGSHRAWADRWRDHSRHELAVIGLEDRFWRWRMRAGAVELAERFESHVAERGRPDAVVVSGIIDAAAFAGLARRALADVPLVVYMHENQLLYPVRPDRRNDVEPGLINWRSLEVADRIWFNSEFHRRALLAELPGFLKRFPEPVPGDMTARLGAKSQVVYPGAETAALIAGPRSPGNAVPLVLWNQRWDPDKNPRVVFEALARLGDEGVRFEVALLGEDKFAAADRQWALDRLGDRVAVHGWLERQRYLEVLSRSDVVVSAADHEFFGIAIVEAIAAGARPLLPDRLVFPELIPPEWHGSVLYRGPELVDRLRELLADPVTGVGPARELRSAMDRFDVAETAATADDAIDGLVGAGVSRCR